MDRAENLNRRKSLHPTTLFNELLRDDRFVRVGPGTYGLREWGLSQVRNYDDIIADVLKREGRGMSYGSILQGVNQERLITGNSLKLSLDLNPRFYLAEDGSYGLRAWLSSRDRQTLRTPVWRRETAQSYERVGRSEARGYSVDEIVAQDL